MWAEVIAGRHLSGWLCCWGEHVCGPMLHSEEESGEQPASPWGRNCAWSSHAKRSEHFFSTFNKKTVHQGPLLRWGPGRCVLLECMCLKFSVDALHSRRDRGKLRETRLSSWNLHTTFLSPPMHWEMFAFASEGPRKGPWCLSTSGAQAVFSKLSTS